MSDDNKYYPNQYAEDDSLTSDDPQAGRAAQGWNVLLNKAGQNLDEQSSTIKNAIAGDKDAQLAVASNSLGAAMGGLKVPEALDMSEAARLARAKKMGFDTSKTYYHGTPQGDIAAFDPYASPRDTSGKIAGFFTEDPKFASKFTSHPDPAHEIEFGSQANILPVHLGVKRSFDYNNSKHVEKVFSSLNSKQLSRIQENAPRTNNKQMSLKDLKQQISLGNWIFLEQPEIIDAIKNSGFDSMHVFENGQKNLAVFDPKHIRSKFAEFDPKKAKKPGLSFAEGGEVPGPPPGLDNFISQPAQPAPITPPPSGLDDFIHEAAVQEKYGSMGQRGITALEGLAQGVAGPVATGIETSLGVSPEAIRGREEANPNVALGAQAAGFLGSQLTGVGEAALLGKAGTAAAKATGMAAKGGFMNHVGAEAVKGALEGAIFQGGEEINKRFKEDPSQSAESAMANIGLMTALTGIGGGALGAALKKPVAQLEAGAAPVSSFVSQIDAPAVEAGAFDKLVQSSNEFKPLQKAGILKDLDLSKKKVNAPAIEKAANVLGAPVYEGMILDSKPIQMAEDSLINGPPTVFSLKRQAMYKDAYDTAAKAVDNVMGAESPLTKAELGNMLKSSIVEDFERQNKPIKEMYDEIKQGTEIIPLAHDELPWLKQSLADIQEFKISPSSPEGQLVKRVISEASNLKTVDDVKVYKSILNRSVSPTASSGEKRMAGILSDKLTDIEERGIENFAKTEARARGDEGRVLGLIEQRKIANQSYKEFIRKVQTLSEQLGKGKVYGVQDATNFLLDKLTPEEVATKLFAKNDSEFLNFFKKEFPQQFEMVRHFQKSLLRDTASKEGLINQRQLFKNLNKLEPEIQKALFTPEELQTIKHAETYINAFPKNFNPSGTANMSAFRSAFEHPVGAVMAHGRDAAITAFIKLAQVSPEVKQAQMLGKATVMAERAIQKGLKALVQGDVGLATIIPITAHRAKLDGLVTQLAANPTQLLQMGDNNPVPDYAAPMAEASARAVNYLSQLKPKDTQKNPLDPKLPPSPVSQAEYNQALDIAENPLIVLNHMHQGTLTSKHMQALKSIYPLLYTNISNQMLNQVMKAVEKDKKIPYKSRQQMSIFLGQPLDSTMTPQAIMGAQQKSSGGQQQTATQPAAGAKHTTSGLDNLVKDAMTPLQSRANHRKH